MVDCLRCSEMISQIYATILNDLDSIDCYGEIASAIQDRTNADSVLIYKLGDYFEKYSLVKRCGTVTDYVDEVDEIPQQANVFRIMSTENSATGWVLIDTQENINSARRHFIKACTLILASEFEKEWVKAMLKKITDPVDLSLSKGDFYNQMNQLSCSATNMQYSAIRKYNHDTNAMECRSFWSSKHGFYDVSKKQYDLSEDSSLYPLFYDVMMTKEINGAIYNDEKYKKLIGDELGVTDIQSFLVLPLSVGGNAFGTISFAINRRIDFSSMWRYGFSCIANSVCGGLRHYEKSKEVSELRSAKFAEFTKIMNYDLVQGLRHSAGNDLHTLYLQLDYVETILSKQELSQKDLQNIREGVAKAEVTRGKAATAIDHQKNVALFKESDHKQFDLMEAFSEAQQLVQYRLDTANNRIHVTSNSPKKLMVFGDKLAVSYAFLNLLLNSIEAFPSKVKGGGARKIHLSIDSKGSKHKISLSDNAGGFKPNYAKELTSLNEIFIPGKTTKETGTGWGLTFVRDVFGRVQKNSSINVRADNSGMTFLIEFPK